MRYAYPLFHFAIQTSPEWSFFVEFLLLGMTAVALLKILFVLWRLLCAWFRSMASMVSLTLALMALAFLVVRLVRFFA